MATKIDTVSARTKLVPRRGPYWHRISKGCYLGFRRMNSFGAGTWLVRALDFATGKQLYKALGELKELPDHQRFDAAQKAAQAWFEHLGRGGSARVTTVGDVCDKYVQHMKTTRSTRAAADIETRFKNYVLNDRSFAETDLAKLTPAHFEHWRNTLRKLPTRSGSRRGEFRSDSTLNRDMTCLRAALNLALADGLATSDFAWRGKLRPIKNADRRRELYLTWEQRRKLVEHADAALAAFLNGLSSLPLRPGALASLCVGDYDARLWVLKIGKDKQGKDRRIKLPSATAELFTQAANDRPSEAPLLARSSGQAWNKDSWKGPIKEAVQSAGLPAETTAYTLRHSVISDLVHGGLDLLTVAQISGTSVAMIEKHYGHLRSDVAAEALARLAL